MIEALRMVDIVKKYNHPKIYRALVQHYAKKGKFQKLVLPIKRNFDGQKSSIVRYMLGQKASDDITMVSCNQENAEVYCTYWNRLHFFKFPPNTKFSKVEDPFQHIYENN